MPKDMPSIIELMVRTRCSSQDIASRLYRIAKEHAKTAKTTVNKQMNRSNSSPGGEHALGLHPFHSHTDFAA
jgi:hypothetical protein